MRCRFRCARWRKSVGCEKGAAMVIALLTIVIMVLLTAALVVASMTETFNAQTAEDAARAFLVADAAAAHAIASLRLDSDWSDNDWDPTQEGDQNCDGGYLYDGVRRRCMGPRVQYPDSGGWVVTPAAGSDPAQPACAAAPVSRVTTAPGSLPESEQIGTYTVEVLGQPEAGRIRLRAVGRVGRAVRGFEFTVERVTPADFVSYSALRVDATRVGNGTFRIHGSVYVRGDWEFKGNSQQLNDRPISEADTQNPVYDNQTFVCGNLVLQGNAQIGMPAVPMLGVHIAGRRIDRGGAAEIHTLLQDAVVPDIRLASIPNAVACIRGTRTRQDCGADGFGSLRDAYTNEIDANGLLVVLRPPQGLEVAWQRDMTQTRDLVLSSQRWRIPKRGQQDACASASDSLGLDGILGPCAAYYDGAGNLYVAARQTVYVPGKLSVLRDVTYRVDDDPTGDPVPSDASTFAVACEPGTSCDPNQPSADYGFDVREMLRARRRASAGFFYPDTTFPSRDLLAFLVHGRVRFGLSGNPANQEVNAVVVSGCELALPPERCDLTMQKNLQLYGSVISRLLVFEQNVDLFQVPDLREYLPFALDRFLNAPGGSAVVVTRWREVGF